MNQVLRGFFLLCALFGLFALPLMQACTEEPAEEKVVQKDAQEKTVPEPVKEEPPKQEEGTPPKGVGNECRISPVNEKGTCPTVGLVCLATSDTKAHCFENCTDDNVCASKKEACLASSKKGIKVCKTMVKAGEKCDPVNRIVCQGDYADPPEFCVQGVCKARPKEGWGLYESCTAPRGDKQSDCKKGLICLTVASGDFRCIQECGKDDDCPKGESCWDKPYGSKACVITAAKGEKCAPSERRFCKEANPAEPLTCREGKCQTSADLKKEGEKCRKLDLLDPSQKRGDCEQGLYCLGVTELEARCQKPCQRDSECKTGQTCFNHPNDGAKPLFACVKKAGDGEPCDIKKGILCDYTKNLRCNPTKEGETDGTCVEVKVGDACINDQSCGKYKCFVLGDPKHRYCLNPCDGTNPKCPNKGACRQFVQDGPFGCIPPGTTKVHSVCRVLSEMAGGPKLLYKEGCISGTLCIVFADGAKFGMCMNQVAGCTGSPCKGTNEKCLPLSQTVGVCGRDCSSDANLCQGGSTCKDTQVGQTMLKICQPK